MARIRYETPEGEKYFGIYENNYKDESVKEMLWELKKRNPGIKFDQQYIDFMHGEGEFATKKLRHVYAERAGGLGK